MKKFLSLLLFIQILNADSILDEYRKYGLVNIEQKLDRALEDETYWKNLIEKTDTRFGYTQKYDSILVCDKNNSTLRVYQKNENGKFVLKNDYKAFTGKNKGDKQDEGDLKTPVGIYKLVKKLSKVDSFYGPFAFVTSYPNLFDKYRNKKGHGIWIHGLPLNQKRDSFTKGCIAINNKGLKCLDDEIKLDKTILLIFESKTMTQYSKEKFAQIAAWLYKWRDAWKYNDIETYLRFYSKDFKRFDGKDFEAFSKYKRRIFAKNEKKQILFEDISILPYPNHPNIYQITFFEKYKSDNYRFEGDKELLIKEIGNRFFIFSER